MKKLPLWLWVGARMTLLAVGAILAIILCMYLHFERNDLKVLQRMAPDDRAAFTAALKDISHNEQQLWGLVEKYFDIRSFLPGDNSDWWTLAGFAAIILPITIILGLLLSRPLSAQFSRIAEAAKGVTHGNLNLRVAAQGRQPAEIKLLCKDFNRMVERLCEYEKEVRESSSNLAHELRTPLNAALGRIQGMLDDIFPLSPEQLLLVQSQLNNLNTLVGDLHLLSLAHAGQFKLNPVPFHLGALVEERVSWFMPQFERTGIEVRTASSEDLCIIGDRSRLGQLINILIENAIKYASDGKLLSILAYREAASVTLEFHDKGHGVDEKDLHNMFVRFWRAEESRARVSGGGGLGLSLAAAIREAHGGSIIAERSQGGGLAVIVRLPFAPPAENCYLHDGLG